MLRLRTRKAIHAGGIRSRLCYGVGLVHMDLDQPCPLQATCEWLAATCTGANVAVSSPKCSRVWFGGGAVADVGANVGSLQYNNKPVVGAFPKQHILLVQHQIS